MNYSFNDERSEITMFCEGDSVRAYNYFGAHLRSAAVKAACCSACGLRTRRAFRLWAISTAGTATTASNAYVVYDINGYEWNDGERLDSRRGKPTP